jgi:hypothetical protein
VHNCVRPFAVRVVACRQGARRASSRMQSIGWIEFSIGCIPNDGLDRDRKAANNCTNGTGATGAQAWHKVARRWIKRQRQRHILDPIEPPVSTESVGGAASVASASGGGVEIVEEVSLIILNCPSPIDADGVVGASPLAPSDPLMALRHRLIERSSGEVRRMKVSAGPFSLGYQCCCYCCCCCC